jgi:hypothetical protein
VTSFFRSISCCTHLAKQYTQRSKMPRRRTAIDPLTAGTAFATAVATQATTSATSVATPAADVALSNMYSEAKSIRR